MPDDALSYPVGGIASVDDARERTRARVSTSMSLTVDTSREELFAVDAALRTALNEPPLSGAHELISRRTLALAIALIARVEEGREIASPSWGTPTKTAVERFAEELEVVLRERDRAEMTRDRALGQRRDAMLAYERLSVRAETNEKALDFARGELVTLTKKLRALTATNGGLRAESTERLDKLKRAEKAVIEARAEANEARMKAAALRKDFEVERQVFKARNVEIARLENLLRIANSGENATESKRNAKRISELEAKIVSLLSATAPEPLKPSNDEHVTLLLVQELAKEELKSRARADAAEKLVVEMREQLDARTAEVISLRQHLEGLDRNFLARTALQSDETLQLFDNREMFVNKLDKNLADSCERAEQLCQRLSSIVNTNERVNTMMGSGGRTLSAAGTPVLVAEEGMIRNLQAALEDHAEPVVNAENIAFKASGEATALREAMANAENIASAAAAVAQARGFTSAYIARNSTDARSPSSLFSPPRQSQQSLLQSLEFELAEAKSTARKERIARVAAEQAIKRWSTLEE